ncbi:hypothetical protein [Maribellus mangrovi]|uniref:hypothetical protein n=1 Tax=Maribellus mangrovi TaxID=3133146 RepID=UPI0030EC677C
MNKILTIMSFAFLLLFFGCKKDHVDGPGDSPFMEELSATLPSEGGKVVLQAKNVFFSIQYLTSIQSGDTIKQSFPDFNAGEQVISGSWFTVETIGNGESALPKEIEVSVQANANSTERQLLITVWNGLRSDLVMLTQSPG